MFLGILLNSTINSRDYGISSIESKANAVAQSVKHGLTAHMMNEGMMENRILFLDQIKTLSDVDDIWVVRGKNVVEQYGEGLLDEVPRDAIDEKVLASGKVEKMIDENIFSKSSFRITIPYVAEKTLYINCTNCHNAKMGETLGAISMVIDIDEFKEKSIESLITITIIGALLIIVVISFVNYTINPYIQIFDSIQETMKRAGSGDYSHRVDGGEQDDAKEVAKWINSLLEKLNKTLEDIESKIKIFISQKQSDEKIDPLLNVRNSVNELAEIYKFKKTIELDSNLEEVYGRLSTILTDDFNLKHFNLLEADTNNKNIKTAFGTGGLVCEALEMGCRADSTSGIVDSQQFKNLCNRRIKQDGKYICVPYSISHNLAFVLNIETETEEEHLKIRENLPLIKDYIETAKPEIVSKKLMNMLEDSARRDELTGLFNRKYLEESIATIVSQSKRSNTSYGVLMCDIDYFKMINDTYGHDVGDEAIRVISKTLQENVRDSDIVIRYGGEEFIVLLYDCNTEYVEEVAQKIRTEFAKKKISSGNESFSKTISIGASIFPQHSDSFWKCIKFADIALYKAKESGRNRVVIFNEQLLENKDMDKDY
jgi:diguanylate cyclase (GGDEF)-like protein